MKALKSFLIWGLVVLVGVIAFATLALSRGEHISAVWLVVAAVSVYCIAYRFYSLYICKNILELDARRMTPAERHNNGVDYVPTNEKVLFGHHFAAIAGAGPLVGPVLASQMGYLPGTLWIIFGVILAGAVQDMMVLFISMRRDGKSLGDIIKQELGTTAGIIASIGILMIMIIITSVLALIVVKALTHSPWGTFTIAATVPIALFMGVYARFIRPGRIGEISIFGFAGLLCAVIFGNHAACHRHHALRRHFFAAAGMAVDDPARLSGHLLENRYDSGFGRGHHHRRPRAENARRYPLHRRQRPGICRRTVPVPVHYHRLRCGIRLPRADFFGYDAEND